MPRTGGLCLKRVVFCRERAIRFPGVDTFLGSYNSISALSLVHVSVKSIISNFLKKLPRMSSDNLSFVNPFIFQDSI